MDQESENPLAGGLVYENSLPLHWESREAGQVDALLVDALDRNEHLLAALIASQGQHHEPMDEETEMAPELLRIEAKLDLLLELMSGLQHPESAPSRICPVELGAKGAAWYGPADRLAPGQGIWLMLRLDPRLPRPLKLPATVVAVEARGDSFRTLVRFDHLGELVPEQLEKIIFRHHRRQVALTRSQRVREEGE